MLPVSLRSGRGLAYLLSAILLASAGALEFYRRHSSTRERARFGLLRDDAELFTDALATSLRLPEVCTSALAGVKVKPGARQALALDYTYDPAIPRPLKAGGEAWPGTQLGRLELTLPKDPDFRTVYESRSLRRFRARIDAEFVIKDRFPTGVPGSLELYVWIDDEDEVRSCMGPMSIGALCNMTGRYYDVAATRPERRCHPLVRTALETTDGAILRGSCRVTGVVNRAAECPGGPAQAVRFQDKVGYRTERRVLCRTCE